MFALGYPAESREQQDRYKTERIHFMGEVEMTPSKVE